MSEDRFFKAGDVQALAEKIREVGGKPLIEEEKARQMEVVAQRYDWGRIARRTLEVYRQVLGS